MKNVDFKTAIFLWFFVIFGALGAAIYSIEKIQEKLYHKKLKL